MRKEFVRVESLADLNRYIRQSDAVAIYFAGTDCGVCDALAPKLKGLFDESFPRIAVVAVDCQAQPDMAAAYSVFCVPTLLVFFQGKEWVRVSRNLSIAELRGQIERLYDMVFA